MAKKDQYRIDSHKLIYHPRRVSDYLEGKTIAPIYMEISPSGTCNHRCVFCSVDFMKYKKIFLDTGVLKQRLTELGTLGVKSIMYAGEGEPFLHRDFTDIVVHTAASGIDVAITTNGVLIDQDDLPALLESTKWIKVSCNAGTPDTYASIHRTKATDFNRVIDNLRAAVEVKKKHGLGCTLGVQILLLDDNHHEVEKLAGTAKSTGVDYLVVKPYTHHRMNRHNIEIAYKEYEALGKKLDEMNSDTFQVIFRAQAMKNWDAGERAYQSCLALPFWSYIDASGNVWGCSAHLKDERFLYGNIFENKFDDIWKGEKREQSMKWFANSFDIKACKLNCRMDKINAYLWELSNPQEHVNFI